MKKILFFLFVIIAGIVQFSCKKNNADGPPMISNVRSLDSTKRDSFFTKAIPGTEIVIQGSNLDGALAVYFNDTSAYFNPVYNTSNTIIVNIPSTSQTAAINPNVPNIIKVVTSRGTATYSFTLYLPPPYISSITFDNSGTLVYINGYNFQGIKKIVFPNANKDTALSYTVNKTFTQIVAVIPPGTPLQDSLRVYCTFGSGSFSYPPPMIISSVSNENAAGGTTITVNGTNFIAINKVTFPGGLLGTNIQSLGVSQFTVKVPAGITTVDSLRITGSLGNATAPQLFDTYISHPSPGYLCTFENQNNGDNTGFVGWTGGYADAPTTTANYPGGTGASGILLQGAPMSANAGPTSQGNPGLMQLNALPWVSNTATSIAGYSMKFELFVVTPWSAGEIWIAVGGWYGWTNYVARFAPWTTAPGNKYQPSGWVTVTIPLTQFSSGNPFWSTAYSTAGSPANTFADYPTTAVGFLIANDQATVVPTKSVNLVVDNIRIVKGQ